MSVEYKNETYQMYKKKTDDMLATLPSFCTKARNERSMRLTQKSHCLLYTSPSPRDGLLSRMPSSA